MKIENTVALVTGGNRGIGLAFAKELLARGARKVYVGAREPSTITLPGVQALRLDVNNLQELAAAAAQATDVELVIRALRNRAAFLRPTAKRSHGASSKPTSSACCA